MSQRGRSQAARTPQTTAIGARSRQVPLGYKVLTTWLNGVFVLAGDDLDGDSGRIPKPCVVGSNPTGGRRVSPLVIPHSVRHVWASRPPDQTGQEDLPRLHAVDWRLGNKAGLGQHSSPGKNAAARPANSPMEGWASDRTTNQTLPRSADEPAFRAIQRRTTRPERADNSTMCLPDALELPCCRVRQ
jgi:hypothetical protein